ncbi:hypothetical protein [Candidatus Formimonas warabiya]|uniref:Uncharacterized protein n=1 Tax=Formimonas warabiya TaxID=1761012 RepID=A0A3G1KSR7_FORW1|nr:hypothetical protein [Candidatus Formimonas warabiya]ATW25563.1 hypothetical protein DCMF_13065 [Candidatus Formimonas warabiya]
MEKIPQEILEAVKEASKDGKLICAEAHALGKELGVSLLLIGAAADELGIKIRECQLGCF